MDKKVMVGGQAVIEGVMMKGPKAIATAVRRKDGTIVYKKIDISKKNNKWSKLPFIRGVISLYDAMIMGTKELIFSSNQSGGEEEKLTDAQVSMTVMVSLCLGVGLFMLLPSMVGTFIGNVVSKDNRIVANVFEAIVRLILFLVYIFGISFMKDVKRVFQYHGAEHKSIFTFEGEKDLTVENAKKCTRLHPRCGTSFLVLVMLISIIVFSFVDLIFPVPRGNMFFLIIYKLITRLIFVPFVAGFSFEIQRWTSYHLDNPIAKLISSPGILLQKITTQEPDEKQLEVALVALNIAIGNEVDNATEVFE